MLAPSPAQDANTFVVTRATAEREDLRTLSDLAAVAPELTFGGPPECPTRPCACRPATGLRAEVSRGAGPRRRRAGHPPGDSAGDVDVALLFTTDPAHRRDLVELDGRSPAAARRERHAARAHRGRRPLRGRTSLLASTRSRPADHRRAAPAERPGRRRRSGRRRRRAAWLAAQGCRDHRSRVDAPSAPARPGSDATAASVPPTAAAPAGAGVRPVRHRRFRAASAPPARAGSRRWGSLLVWAVVAHVFHSVDRVTDRRRPSSGRSPACAPTG